MRKILATTLFAALLTGCSAPDYQAMSIQEIVETTTVQEKHVWATTEFVIKGTGEGRRGEEGRLYLNSETDYRSSNSLNVHLSRKIVDEFKTRYDLTDVKELEGKKVRVSGLITPKAYCVNKGCPRSAVSPKPDLYYQNQLLITDLENITII